MGLFGSSTPGTAAPGFWVGATVATAGVPGGSPAISAQILAVPAAGQPRVFPGLDAGREPALAAAPSHPAHSAPAAEPHLVHSLQLSRTHVLGLLLFQSSLGDAVIVLFLRLVNIYYIETFVLIGVNRQC